MVLEAGKCLPQNCCLVPAFMWTGAGMPAGVKGRDGMGRVSGQFESNLCYYINLFAHVGPVLGTGYPKGIPCLMLKKRTVLSKGIENCEFNSSSGGPHPPLSVPTLALDGTTAFPSSLALPDCLPCLSGPQRVSG